jgi:hypothetical protein
MPRMYSAVLFLHSYVRWVVIVLGLIAWLRAVAGRSTMAATPGRDDVYNRGFLIAFNLQITLGLLMYLALSPLTYAAFHNMGAAMGDALLRFFTVEHPFGMIAALVLAQIGRARGLRAKTAADARRQTIIFFGLALVLILASIPWPFVAAGRPYFR